jgi:hypothetical protein
MLRASTRDSDRNTSSACHTVIGGARALVLIVDLLTSSESHGPDQRKRLHLVIGGRRQDPPCLVLFEPLEEITRPLSRGSRTRGRRRGLELPVGVVLRVDGQRKGVHVDDRRPTWHFYSPAGADRR